MYRVTLMLRKLFWYYSRFVKFLLLKINTECRVEQGLLFDTQKCARCYNMACKWPNDTMTSNLLNTIFLIRYIVGFSSFLLDAISYVFFVFSKHASMLLHFFLCTVFVIFIRRTRWPLSLATRPRWPIRTRAPTTWRRVPVQPVPSRRRAPARPRSTCRGRPCWREDR